jgi:hypothetical protein
MKELDVDFIETGPFTFSTTTFIDQHLRFNPETEIISIYTDHKSLSKAYARFLKTGCLGTKTSLRAMTDALVVNWASICLYVRLI